MALTKVRGSGVTGMTISASNLILPKIPILQVAATDTDQSMSAGVDTKVEWETVEIDSLSGWSTSNNRYTPTVAGYYLVGGSVRVNLSNIVEFLVLSVNKNGSSAEGVNMLRNQFNYNSDTISNSSFPIPTGLMQMNGSSDYIEVFARSDEAATIHDATAPKSHFFAQLVHAT